MGKFMIWVFIAGIFIFLFSGCATTTRTAYGFGTGVAKDAQDTTNAIIRADQWFRENCW